jgi:hypothetical protein
MTDDPDTDAARLSEISRELPPLDLDATTAERIALKARANVGKRPPRTRLVLPILAMLVVAAYTAWAIAKLIDVLT